jgi:hypothetical protein
MKQLDAALVPDVSPTNSTQHPVRTHPDTYDSVFYYRFSIQDTFTMMHTFKTSSSLEITALIKKHGTTDALLIKNLSYFTNVPLKDIDEIGVKSMKTVVRYIA